MKIDMLIRAKTFLSSWKNLLALGTLLPLAGWIYSRVWMVNPAILGDEYLYSMNSRKAAPWEPSPAGDFSNYLFNFVYQGTNLCGEAFYSCAKILNLVFFLGFIFILFIVGRRFLPFWAAYGFMIAAGLSPLSVYTSMFLPESMYMFFIGLLLIAVLHAIREFSWQNWALAGAAIGIASLVKPHAWLSAIAVGITLLVVGLGNREVGLKITSKATIALIAGAALSRVFVGLIVAGPKALGFFGQYLGGDTVQQVITAPSEAESGVVVGVSPMTGVFALFGPQLNIHLLVTSALMGISVVGLFAAVVEILRTRKLTPVTGFGLFTFVWLFSLILEIVIFTGWVTGGGDDHTTRVLLRYYEFLFLIAPLAGLSLLSSSLNLRINIWFRWGLLAVFATLLTPAFTGFFATLTIQIADAPTLAGLVVNSDVFNAAAIIGLASILLFATFPRYSNWSFLLLLPVTMIATGWQIQDQYQQFRGEPNAADIAGNYLRDNLSKEQIDRGIVLATSRFDATNVAFWADSPSMRYELFSPGSEVTADLIKQETTFVVAMEGISLQITSEEIIEGNGYTIYILK